LTLAGIGYAVLAIMLNLLLQPLADSAQLIPVDGIIAMLIVNALQGMVLGLIAWTILRLTGRAPR
jgi:hypothetical protein